ncbi:MAG: hypothetical protein IT538_00845 [Variibacter sp.]|nr:hypothetical protein [Variibacter sp.]
MTAEAGAGAAAALAAMREQRLRRTLRAVAAAHPFYRRVFAAMDELAVRIERDAPEAASDALREKVIRLVRAAVSLRPEVEWVVRGSIYDHERSIKARRVVNQRPPAE